jgi:hypothetical protein
MRFSFSFLFFFFKKKHNFSSLIIGHSATRGELEGKGAQLKAPTVHTQATLF